MHFYQRVVPVNCPTIFSDSVFIERGHGEGVPFRIHTNAKNEFTLNGAIPVRTWYFDQNYHAQTTDTRVWDRTLVEEWIRLASVGELVGNYGRNETNHLKNALGYAKIQGGRILVIGSEVPWVEALVLSAGVRSRS